MGYMIEITEAKAEKMVGIVEQIARHAGELMYCLNKARNGGDYDENDDYDNSDMMGYRYGENNDYDGMRMGERYGERYGNRMGRRNRGGRYR